MWHEVLVAMALVCGVWGETTVAVDETTGTEIPMTTAEPITEFSLAIAHMQSTTGSIKFKWEASVPKWMKVQNYEITASKKDSDAVITYPTLGGYEDWFEADDLVKDSQYEVCMTSTVKNDTENVEFRDCFDSFTIPYVRPDSIYVLFLVLGYILLMILIGYISWRCAVAKAEKEAAAAEAEEEENEEEEKKEN